MVAGGARDPGQSALGSSSVGGKNGLGMRLKLEWHTHHAVWNVLAVNHGCSKSRHSKGAAPGARCTA